MAFTHTNKKGQKYILHSTDVKLRGSGRTQTIYYFARTEKSGALDAVPSGYIIVENERTGLPILKRG